MARANFRCSVTSPRVCETHVVDDAFLRLFINVRVLLQSVFSINEVSHNIKTKCPKNTYNTCANNPSPGDGATQTLTSHRVWAMTLGKTQLTGPPEVFEPRLDIWGNTCRSGFKVLRLIKQLGGCFLMTTGEGEPPLLPASAWCVKAWAEGRTAPWFFNMPGTWMWDVHVHPLISLIADWSTLLDFDSCQN